jgi:heptaprenylglyceryl phosphate synthase
MSRFSLLVIGGATQVYVDTIDGFRHDIRERLTIEVVLENRLDTAVADGIDG